MFAIQKKNTPVRMLVGRDRSTPMGAGADILLSGIPWVPLAVNRAQDNPVDFGFGPLPVLTVEDVLNSKCYALGKAVSRPMDLDDVRSILTAGHALDRVYIRTQLEKHGVHFSKTNCRHFPALFWKLTG